MSVAWQIPLESQNQFDTGKMLSLGKMATDLQASQQKLQGQNALRKLFMTPGAVDAAGNPTPQTIQAASAIDPQTGMDLRKTALDAQLQQVQMQHYKTEAGKQKFDYMSSAAGAAVDAYDNAVKAGAKPEDAQAAAVKARNDVVRENGGVLGQDDVDRITAQPFQLDQAKAFAGLNPDYVAKGEKQQALSRQDRQLEVQTRAESERERHDSANEANIAAGLSLRERNVNPATQAYESFMAANPAATPQEQADFIQRSKAAPRSAPAMAMQKFLQENPDATAEDVSKFNADIKSTAKATSDFSTGKQGQAVNSFNVGISHLDTLKELGGALKNNDIKMFNKIANKWAEETGQPAPTNFNTAKQIIGAEVVKSIVGAGGGVAERQEASNNISAASSPEQLMGAIETTQKLMGGQLRGLKKQYEDTTKKKDFLDRLTPEARKIAESLDKDEGGGSSTKPKPGTIRARDPSGALHEAKAGTPLPAGWTAE